ncbi:hypothetical protein GGR10_000557 [Bartonella chomelii]|uniref:Uncharacterized protein n=1 Tax=Bartonella chomelii TaxID=236402 RepID=A0ABR6E2C2_9HYPH|nr:hypothetical protein [Bartonella chomelii]
MMGMGGNGVLSEKKLLKWCVLTWALYGVSVFYAVECF